MRLISFKKSANVSIGIELEIQIINPHTYNLMARAKDLMRSIQTSPFQKRIKPEITQSMIEINSSVHQSPLTALQELIEIHGCLEEQAQTLGILFAGGGTHPFQKWSVLKIFPATRFKKLARQYRYLSKRSTVFGQHIHVGCSNAEDALYLTHALTRYAPHLIAITASSPFYQGVDTGYNSARSNVFTAFPLSGVIPYLTNWREFSTYFYEMRNLGIIETMKDFYWDIRPKPEFGTVEIRVCDTPLTVHKAIIVAAYLQALSQYLLKYKPIKISHDLYYLYNYNRFQAVRYGFDGIFIDPVTHEHLSIDADILNTINKINDEIIDLKTESMMAELVEDVKNKRNDTALLRNIHKQHTSLARVVSEQCKIWTNGAV